jgi:predicted Zn-dependent peptidase
MVSGADLRRCTLSVLNMGLGGGVSCWLFQRLRERKALIYSVGSFAEQYLDSELRCQKTLYARRLTRTSGTRGEA